MTAARSSILITPAQKWVDIGLKESCEAISRQAERGAERGAARGGAVNSFIAKCVPEARDREVRRVFL